jgi:hypothetical protein
MPLEHRLSQGWYYSWLEAGDITEQAITAGSRAPFTPGFGQVAVIAAGITASSKSCSENWLSLVVQDYNQHKGFQLHPAVLMTYHCRLQLLTGSDPYYKNKKNCYAVASHTQVSCISNYNEAHFMIRVTAQTYFFFSNRRQKNVSC